MANCNQCKLSFEITDEDRKFLDKVSPFFNKKKHLIPEPTLCPDCRQQRRLVWRNERKLYKRKCDLCKKNIISMYRQDTAFPVYCLDCWWGDDWNPMDYGRGFDFNRPFFEQFAELRDKVPHFSLAVLRATMENSDYCNHAGSLKNCYLLINSDESEQCLYGKGVNRCFDCIDCFKVYDSQACYEASNCNNCTFSTYLIDSYTCDKCHFSSNLIGCKNCFGCCNLRNKEYFFFNEKLSSNDYKNQVKKILGQKNHQDIWKKFQEFRSKQIMKWMQEKNTENCTGDYLVQCKNCFSCYDCEYLEDSKYCTDLKKGEKASFENYDISYFGLGVDASYECSVAGYNANHILFCENVWQSYDVLYSQLCTNSSHHLFGCVGMKHGKYAIFNKQYSEEEYNEIASKIVDHMKTTGEWGEFFHSDFTPYAYNETVAQEYYPLNKEAILQKSLKWHDDEEPDYSDVTKKIPAEKLPKDISQISDDILNWAIECEKTGKLFKIQKLELDFYRKMNLPIPKLHPDVRHQNRFKMRNPRKLWDRKCNKCQKSIQTTYSPDRPETVYCEECYLKTVY